MSSSETIHQSATASTPPEIQSVLARLRRRIRTYVFLEGLAWVLVVVGALFWITLGLNWGYFKLSRLELPRWFRIALDLAAVLSVVAVLLALLAWRLFRQLRTKALALVLERRFPTLDDRLITAVEAPARRDHYETEFTQALRQRTVDEARQEAERLPLKDVFQGRPLGVAATLATFVLASVITFGVLNSEAVGYWYRAFVGLDDEYWDRDTLLVPRVFEAAVNDVREFGEERIYKHPRGADFTLSVFVPEEDEETGKKWLVPEEVYWDYELDGGRGGAEILMNPVRGSEREFRQTVSNLLDGMTFTVFGGDYRSRLRYRVMVVDPPTIDEVRLERRYPDYTRLNNTEPPKDDDERKQRELQELVRGTSVSLPLETQLLMHATANKPLNGLRIETDQFFLTVRAANVDENGDVTEPGTAKLELLSQDGLPYVELPFADGFATKVLTAGSDKLHLPMALNADAELQLSPPVFLPLLTGGVAGSVSSAAWVGSSAKWMQQPLTAIPLSANTLLRVFLEDTDGIISQEASRLTINGIADLSPEIEAKFRGIGEFITAKASIPVTGEIRDDYGVADARFEYRVATPEGQFLTGPAWQVREFENPPNGVSSVYQFQSDEQPATRFDVSKILVNDETGPRPLKIGDVLHLSIYAEDGDDINGPHGTRAQPKPEYVFRVVSQEELLTILYQKELGLLARFEQVIEEVGGADANKPATGVLAELQKATELANTINADPESESESERENRLELTSIATRSMQKISKDAADTRSIQQDFEEILEELGNNGIANPKMVQSLRELIIDPLDRIGERRFPAVDEALVKFKDVQENKADPRSAIADSVSQTEALLRDLRIVLKEMQELASYQELVGNLQQMIEATKKAKELAEEQQIDDLNKVLELFD
ncbi:hypothetical protein [Thalassoroseus pseudoceratinae]|uniref:hypothetical protein n=1 Tax=Thalassoroseus pseudoceratinae TaxID=2713176 RepID=UPI001421B4F4|nr:hypothetical protein [Thalassoroseus pseudoceratinae]